MKTLLVWLVQTTKLIAASVFYGLKTGEIGNLEKDHNKRESCYQAEN